MGKCAPQTQSHYNFANKDNLKASKLMSSGKSPPRSALMKARNTVYLSVVLLIATMGLTVACNRAPNDSQISNQLQDKLKSDSGLQGKNLSVQSENGAVTLSGTVDNDAQRDAASRYAAAVPGVKQVINNLQVAPATAAVAPAPTPEPAPQETPKPAPAVRRDPPPRRHVSPKPVAEVASAGAGAGAASMAMAHQDSSPAPVQVVPSTPPPPPPPQKVTIPAGTTLAVRLVDAIDSEKNQPGETFRATLNSPLAVDGEIAIPAGYDVEGHLVDVKSAGKFAGQSVVVLQLDRISVGGRSYSVQTDQYKRQGSSRGKNTAEKVGAGAAIGAIIGGIAGGGKGAGIGAAAGGGLGGGVQAATKGQQIKLPSETVLNFTLQNPLTVIPTGGPDSHRHRMDAPSADPNNPQQ
jgi:BON domain